MKNSIERSIFHMKEHIEFLKDNFEINDNQKGKIEGIEFALKFMEQDLKIAKSAYNKK